MSSIKKNFELEFIEMVRETTDIYSFVFRMPESLEWVPGQHAVFRNLQCKAEGDKNYRIYSLASIVEEGKVMFSTRITSESTACKKMLLELKNGDKISMEEPEGKFYLKEYNRPVAIIVGGIGITPVRAFLKDMDFKEINPQRLELLYADDRGEFAYKETLKALDEKYDGFHLNLINDRSMFIKQIEESSKNMKNTATYYISGTPSMNAMIKEKLLEMGVEAENIKTDNFIGY